ncbi:MAG: anti-phage dCTP deaminase [Rhizorhabdus sp.]
MNEAKPLRVVSTPTAYDDGRAILQSKRSSELFFAVVGPVGAGGSRAIGSLQSVCEAAGYKCELVKMSALIVAWATEQGEAVPENDDRTLNTVTMLQNLGDKMRKRDPSAVARAALAEIAMRRAAQMGKPFEKGKPVTPDEVKRAYLIDSIRHPAETNLFRRTYANAFALIGVVCEEGERRHRILGKYLTKPQQHDLVLQKTIDEFIARDADDSEASYGQHVTDAFYEADFFLDNTGKDEIGEVGLLDEPLTRLVSIVAHDRLIRPTIEETAMHHAHSARVRSACLSRQVGAALVDTDGTVVATGTNEVPKAGGGVYGEHFASSHTVGDQRCAFRDGEKFCASNREQNAIITELITSIPELRASADRLRLLKEIRKTRLGQLIEFSRAVHAEMDALLSAGREGVSTVGTRLFVTTFPCHYCARHIVSAGVYEVQFIEPYPKSLALDLHRDAIDVNESGWVPPEITSMAEEKRMLEPKETGRVLFRPFIGVAPRLYLRAFEKTRRLKDKLTGDMTFETPDWGDEWSPFTAAYPELEAALTRRT